MIVEEINFINKNKSIWWEVYEKHWRKLRVENSLFDFATFADRGGGVRNTKKNVVP